MKPSVDRCTFQYQRGKHSGDICPKLAYGNTPYCEFCLLRGHIGSEYPIEVAKILNEELLKLQPREHTDTCCTHCNGTGIEDAL